ILLIEGTTPCLVGTRMMKESGWTHEPVYKLAVSVFWIFWLVVRIVVLAAGLLLFASDISRGRVPDHVPWGFVVTNGLSIFIIFGLSCAWFVTITRITYRVVTGKLNGKSCE
ncbi:unnamed protein product, partial [Polarella glacialis]